MYSEIKSVCNGDAGSGDRSRGKKQRILKAYGEEYEIPVKTAEFSERLDAVMEAIMDTSVISGTVREIKKGIGLFIGEDEAERIFPDEAFGQIDTDEILCFWLALNYELFQSQDA